jgi:hypothetical protein
LDFNELAAVSWFTLSNVMLFVVPGSVRFIRSLPSNDLKIAMLQNANTAKDPKAANLSVVTYEPKIQLGEHRSSLPDHEPALFELHLFYL